MTQITQHDKAQAAAEQAVLSTRGVPAIPYLFI